MYSWIAGRIARAVFGRLAAGDVRTLVRAYAPDAQFVFPGTNSFAGTQRGRAEIQAWLERFVGLHPSFDIQDVLVAGPPWNLRVALRFTDRIAIPGGGDYDNEVMEHLRLRWGRVVEHRVYLDTERVAALDERLAGAEALRPAGSRAPAEAGWSGRP